jgi:hypothetical protein
MGDAFSLVRTRVTVTTDQLQHIVEYLGITTKTHRDNILRDGIVIVKAPSPPGGGGQQRARARSTSSPATNRASSTTSRRSRRRT